jgi:hydrogenase maturation factor HypE
MNNYRPATAIILTLLFFTHISGSSTRVADKVTPEELVAKHVEAIGTAEARKTNRSRIVAGTSVINLKTGGRGNSSGPALLASQHQKVLLKAEFS